MISVIIVEDEEMIRQGLVSTINWLEMDSVVVADAKDGEEGLEKIMKYNPDVVISDIRMPKLNGLDMIEKAKSLGLNFESIMLTSYSDFEYAKKSIDLKVQDYILKPISEDKLKEVMAVVKEKCYGEKYSQKLNEVAKHLISVMDIEEYFNDAMGNKHVTYALEQVKLRFKEKISIEAIADELCISASYLSRTFKKSVSMNFLEFLNRYRVTCAIELLSIGKYKVYEVSEQVGYSNYKHFFEIFKKYTNKSPSDFIAK